MVRLRLRGPTGNVESLTCRDYNGERSGHQRVACEIRKGEVMIRHAASLGLGFALLLAGSLCRGEEPADSRTFLFTYEATITGLTQGTTARVWLPVPPSDSDQDVTLKEEELHGGIRQGKEPTYGNTVLY